MAESTAISWCDTRHPDGTITRGATWNTIVGCTHVSDGCRFCYAETLAQRWNWGKDGFKPWAAGNAANIVLKEHRLREPIRWRTPRRVFVNSLSDLFHEAVPFRFLDTMFRVMLEAPQHTYIVLTKRPRSALAYWHAARHDHAHPFAQAGGWPAHIWLGATVENRKALERIAVLRAVPAPIRLLSCEPLLEDLGPVDLDGISWVIAGGESGAHLRLPQWSERWMQSPWPRHLRDQCVAHDPPVAFYLKQNSAVRAGRDAFVCEDDGRATSWRQWPGELYPPEEVSAA